MIALTNPATGHRISTDDESVEFWQAAGYRVEEKATKAPAKRSAAKKSSTKK